MSTGQPSPAPKHPIARRLEDVRGPTCLTIKDFWKRLAEGVKDEGFVSYASALNYHHDRAATISYLVRVAEVFGVSLWWLATGEGKQLREVPVPAERETELLSKANQIGIRAANTIHTAVDGFDLPFGVDEIVRHYAWDAFFWKRIGSGSASDFSAKEVQAALERQFATALQLSRSAGAGYGEVKAAFSSTAATLYLQVWAGSKGPPASKIKWTPPVEGSLEEEQTDE